MFYHLDAAFDTLLPFVINSKIKIAVIFLNENCLVLLWVYYGDKLVTLVMFLK